MATQDDNTNVNTEESDVTVDSHNTDESPVNGAAEKLSTANGSSEKKPYEFSGLKNGGGNPASEDMDFILDIPLEITVELGRTTMLINDLLKLGQGSIIELAKSAGETLEILANNRLIAKGDVVVINEKYGIRLTEVVTTVERIERLG